MHLAQYFLIVVAPVVKNIAETLNAIFELLWKNGLLYSHVLIQEQPQFWSMFTFMPFQRDCFTLAPVKVASFTPLNFTKNMNASVRELFPQKLNNFRKCPLYVAPSFLKPYLFVQNDSDGRPHYRGIDINILNHVAKALNFDIIYKRASNSSGHGSQLPDGTLTDNIALVSVDRIKNTSE